MAASKTAAPAVLTIPEAAARLRCSRGHVYNLIAAGDLDVVDIAPTGSTQSKTRVIEASVSAFLESRIRNARQLRSAS